MSITIHMGYKLKNEQILNERKENLRNSWKQNAIKGLAYELLKKVWKEESKSFDQHYEEMKTKQEKISNSQLRQLDYDYDAQLVRIKDTDLFMFYSEDKEQKEVFEKTLSEALLYYPYYNNTDNREGLTEEEWEERGKEWKKALFEEKDIEDVKEEVVSYKCFPNKEEFFDFIQSEEMKEIKNRFIKKESKDTVMYDVVDKRMIGKEYQQSDILDCLLEVSEEIREGVHEKEIKNKEKEIKEKLKNI